MNDTRAAEWALRIVVPLQCLGLWKIAHNDETTIGESLFVTLEWSEASMLFVDRGLAWAALIASCLLLLKLKGAVGRAATIAACAFVATWFGTVSLLSWYQGGHFGYEYSVAAHATRIFAPVALAVLVSTSLRRVPRTELILRLAAAMTFATHGMEALEHNPEFIDFLITFFRRSGLELSEPTARTFLTAIGVQDIILAMLLLTRRWRAVAAYMTFWGFITAGARIVHLGWFKWPATVVRAANWGVPLALLLLWSKAQHGEAENRKEEIA